MLFSIPLASLLNGPVDLEYVVLQVVAQLIGREEDLEFGIREELFNIGEQVIIVWVIVFSVFVSALVMI
jgi:hypothetical protein